MLSVKTEPFLLFKEGVFSITSSCVIPLIPFFIILSFALSLQAKERTMPQRLLLSVLISLSLISGCMLSFAAVASPFSSVAHFVLNVKPLLGVWLGWGVVLFCAFRFFITRKILYAPFISFFLALASGLALTAHWSPCIGSQLGGLQHITEGKNSFLFLYLAGFSLPFLLLGSVTALFNGEKLLKEESLQKLYNGTIVLALISVLSGIVRV